MTFAPYTCDLDPVTKTTLKIYLFRNVQNVDFIRTNIIKGVWKCTAIKPSLIVHPFQVCVAGNKAAVAASQNAMVTRTVQGEVLYNLSLTKNISQSLTKFGIEKDQDILLCFLVTADDDSSIDIIPKIQGEPCPLSELKHLTNFKEVKNTYKLNNCKSNDEELLDIIVSRMVTKNIVSY